MNINSTFDRACTDLFFDVVDRRYEKEGPSTMVLTSNTPVNRWGEFFDGDDALLCALDRIFDRATVYLMGGPSFRGHDCETLSVEAAPVVTRTRM
ncbi:MAG: ATP-binding protein [Coriobacteriales bacterium]